MNAGDMSLQNSVIDSGANQVINKVHGVMEVAYYIKAIQHIRKAISSPHLFVFSDNIEWAKNNLGLQDETTFVSHNKGASSYEDM
jgi:L-rhamnose isomerase